MLGNLYIFLMIINTCDRMRHSLAIFFICSAYLCCSAGLSFADGPDIADSSTAGQDASLLNLSINGTKFNDLVGDGLRSKDEPGLAGWTIILTIEGQERLQTTTDDEGRYSFQNLEPGKYSVSENSVTGWNQTCPAGGSYEINLVDRDAFSYDFGNHFGPMDAVVKNYPVMSRSAWLDHFEGVKKLSEAEASNATYLSGYQANLSFPNSFSLLSHVPYIPGERDQGSCGNCWVWGCTVPIELANYFQNNISDRLSIQYLNSNYNGGSGSWACCGGWEGAFTSFYNSRGKFVPWSNANANYHDGNRGCSGSTSVPAGSLSTTPNYPITSLQWHLIPTRGSGITQDQAINNIKTILNQNKAVTLGFYLPDFSPFWSYWSSSSGVWHPDLYCGLYDGAYPGGHEVVIVGYNDTNPSNAYWIALNSWGTDAAHPDGTFKVDMDMNYGCSNGGYYSYDFGYFDVAFSTVNTPPGVPAAPSGPDSGTIETTYNYTTSATDPDGDQVRYIFDWDDGTAQSQTGFVNSGSSAGVSHSWSEGGTYLIRALAMDTNGASSGWSDITTVAIDAPPNTPPGVAETPVGPDSGYTKTTYSYSTSATDPDGDRVRYTFDWGDGTAQSQAGLVDSGSSAGASHSWSTAGTYLMRAFATDSRGLSSEWSNTTAIAVSEVPNRSPEPPSAPTGPVSGTTGTTYIYVTSATDPDGDKVRCTFDWGDETAQSQTGLVNSGSSAGAIHSWSTAGIYQIGAFATDSRGGSSEWSDFTTVVIDEPPNTQPKTPSIPSGMTSGKAGVSYSYTTYASDPDRDQVKYEFDWGDGTTNETGYVASGMRATGSHIWGDGGTYQVKAMATDSKGATSGWSGAKKVTIIGNRPPGTPTRPTGLSTGKTGVSYSYATYATDLDKDQVKYTFDWGDGTIYETGYVASGTRTSASHIWSSGGTYAVKTMATDIKGESSGWSYPISVTINTPPDMPDVPSGPILGIHGTSYVYTTSATDADGNRVKCTFNWGDGTITTTALVNSGASISASHRWIRGKTYLVKAKATDQRGESSEWSDPLSVDIS